MILADMRVGKTYAMHRAARWALASGKHVWLQNRVYTNLEDFDLIMKAGRLVGMNDLDAMLDGYVECAIWANGLENLDIDADSKTQAMLDVAAFATANEQTINFYLQQYRDAGQIGHDLWLSRNRCGSGFWKRPKSEHPASFHAACNALQQSAEAMGERNAFVSSEDSRLATIE